MGHVVGLEAEATQPSRRRGVCLGKCVGRRSVSFVSIGASEKDERAILCGSWKDEICECSSCTVPWVRIRDAALHTRGGDGYRKR